MTSAIVLDTDVFSFVAKRDSRASLYTSALTGKQACICFQTVAELTLWTLTRQWSDSRRRSLDDFIRRFVVLPYDSAMSQCWAEITAHRRRLGRRIECGDAWIAAAAVRHNAVLITHNSKDFEDVPKLQVISRANG